MDDETAWATAYAAGLGPAVHPAATVRWVESGSGARLAFCGDVVLKLHHERTDEGDLAARLRAIRTPGLAALLVQPLTSSPGRSPDGRLVTAWPHVGVLAPDDPDLPWAEAGTLLARLHRVTPPPDLPGHGGVGRVLRALARVPVGEHSGLLREVGERLARHLAEAGERHTLRPIRVVHGDWHLGQLARTPAGWRLIDLDDLGSGDPAWDLARPAGFWAAGLLDDASWEAFLGAYRGAGGPAVPTAGDPWPALDLPARCAVFVAAVRELRRIEQGDGEAARALLGAIARM